jgi:anti-sigma factor RsiW
MKLPKRSSDRVSFEDLLARLADGSIARDERAELERALATSPELQAKLDEQRRALAIVAALDVEAPARLLERLASPPRAMRRARRRIPVRGLIMVAAAAVILALLARSNRADDVRSEVHITLERATLAGPPRATGQRAVLTAAVDGIAFPDWQSRGWLATGARTDSFAGRAVETVFYSSPGYGRVGYSIAAGAPLPVGGAQRVLRGGGVAYAVLSADGATVVTWLRDGHTCVLASKQAPAAALLALAGWA